MINKPAPVSSSIRPVKTAERLIPKNPVVNKGYQAKPVLILRWLGEDRSLVSISPPGAAPAEGMGSAFARSYEELVGDHPAFREALERGFEGQPAAITAELNNTLVDVQITPDLDAGGRVSTVMAIFSDASERIASLRAVKVIELLSDLRKWLSQSANLHVYLKKCCEVLEGVYEGVWIGEIADGNAVLKIVTGSGRCATHFTNQRVSIDASDASSFHCVGTAIRSSRTSTATNIHSDFQSEAYRGWADGWTAIVSVPVIVNGHSVGVLNVLDNDPSLCSPQVVGILEEIAAEICSGWHYFQLRQHEESTRTQGKGLAEQYRLLLSTMLDVIVIHRGGKILDVNEAGVRLLKAVTKDELLGTHLKTLLVPEKRNQQYELLVSEEHRQLLEYKLQSFNGDVIEVEGVTYPGIFEGASALQTSFRDITERNQVNTKLRAAKQSLDYAQQVAQIGHVRIDLINDEEEWSENATAILGRPEGEHERRFLETCQQQMNVVDFDALNHAYWSIISTGKRQRIELYVASAADLSKRVVNFSGIPETNDTGKVTHVVFVMQDVTRYQLRLKSTQRALSEAEELLNWASTGCINIHSTSACSLETALVTLVGPAVKMFGREASKPGSITLDKVLEAADPVGRQKVDVWLRQEGAGSEETTDLGILTTRSGREELKSLAVIGERIGDIRRLVVRDVTDFQALKLEYENISRRFGLSKKVARMVEWYYDVIKEEIHWRSDVEEFLGHKLPVPHLTYDQFMGTVRAEDRPGIRAAVNHTIRTREPGDMVYVQKFHSLPDIQLYGRWVPHIVDGGLVGLLGVSIDVSRMKMPTFNQADIAEFDRKSGLPKRGILMSRLKYIEKAGSWKEGVELIGFRVRDYREHKLVIPDPEDFYRIQRDWESTLKSHITNFDTLIKLEAGMFVVLLRGHAESDVTDQVKSLVSESFRVLFKQHQIGGKEVRITAAQSTIAEPVDVDIAITRLESRLRAPEEAS